MGMYERLTGLVPRFSVFVVAGNAETMEVGATMLWYKGKTDGWQAASLESLKQRIRKWVALAQLNFENGCKDRTGTPNAQSTS